MSLPYYPQNQSTKNVFLWKAGKIYLDDDYVPVLSVLNKSFNRESDQYGYRTLFERRCLQWLQLKPVPKKNEKLAFCRTPFYSNFVTSVSQHSKAQFPDPEWYAFRKNLRVLMHCKKAEPMSWLNRWSLLGLLCRWIHQTKQNINYRDESVPPLVFIRLYTSTLDLSFEEREWTLTLLAQPFSHYMPPKRKDRVSGAGRQRKRLAYFLCEPSEIRVSYGETFCRCLFNTWYESTDESVHEPQPELKFKSAHESLEIKTVTRPSSCGPQGATLLQLFYEQPFSIQTLYDIIGPMVHRILPIEALRFIVLEYLKPMLLYFMQQMFRETPSEWFAAAAATRGNLDDLPRLAKIMFHSTFDSYRLQSSVKGVEYAYASAERLLQRTSPHVCLQWLKMHPEFATKYPAFAAAIMVACQGWTKKESIGRSRDAKKDVEVVVAAPAPSGDADEDLSALRRQAVFHEYWKSRKQQTQGYLLADFQDWIRVFQMKRGEPLLFVQLLSTVLYNFKHFQYVQQTLEEIIVWCRRSLNEAKHFALEQKGKNEKDQDQDLVVRYLLTLALCSSQDAAPFYNYVYNGTCGKTNESENKAWLESVGAWPFVALQARSGQQCIDLKSETDLKSEKDLLKNVENIEQMMRFVVHQQYLDFDQCHPGWILERYLDNMQKRIVPLPIHLRASAICTLKYTTKLTATINKNRVQESQQIFARLVKTPQHPDYKDIEWHLLGPLSPSDTTVTGHPSFSRYYLLLLDEPKDEIRVRQYLKTENRSAALLRSKRQSLLKEYKHEEWCWMRALVIDFCDFGQVVFNRGVYNWMTSMSDWGDRHRALIEYKANTMCNASRFPTESMAHAYIQKICTTGLKLIYITPETSDQLLSQPKMKQLIFPNELDCCEIKDVNHSIAHTTNLLDQLFYDPYSILQRNDPEDECATQSPTFINPSRDYKGFPDLSEG
jgi:hypothetical protein